MIPGQRTGSSMPQLESTCDLKILSATVKISKVPHAAARTWRSKINIFKNSTKAVHICSSLVPVNGSLLDLFYRFFCVAHVYALSEYYVYLTLMS